MIKSPSRLVSALAVALLLVACGSRISHEMQDAPRKDASKK
jgi:hypothetical protein